MKTSALTHQMFDNRHYLSLSCLLVAATLAACGGGNSDGEQIVEKAKSTSNGRKPPKGTTFEPVVIVPTEPAPTEPAPTEPAPTEPTPTVISTVPVAPAPTPVSTAPFTCAADAITCVEVASTGSQVQSSVPVTFGQPFKAGDWQFSTQGLVAKVDGAVIPLQTDEISSHRDGSARFAVLSAQLNNLQPGQSKIINFYTGAKSTSTPNVPANPDWNLELEAQVYDSTGGITTLVALPQAELVKQISSNTGKRLSGGVANEYTVVLPFKNKATGATHPHLTARLHTRMVDGGQRIRTDVVMENTRTWTANPSNITYSFAVKRNGSTVYTQPKFTHYHHARWHKVLWTGASAEPQAYVRHNMPYFMASKAVWNYNLALTIPESTLANDAAALAKVRTDQAALGPMANLFLQPYFPMTGGRSEIGPYPTWTVKYLLSQDPRAFEIMIANASAAASVPVHYRDESTDRPIDLDKYPYVSMNSSWSNPVLPPVTNGTTIWEADIAHQGSFTYVPYLVTGDAFYLDEMTFWTAWNAAAPNPTYRGAGLGLTKENQVRGQAWAMRALGETYRALPDNHPSKAYFGRQLEANLDWYVNAYPRNANASQFYSMNAMPKSDDWTLTGPWQNDYFAIVFAQLAENGESKAAETLNWVSKFNLGRFNAEADGFCTAYAAGYYFNVQNANRVPYGSWRDLFQANYPGTTCSSSLVVEGYPEWAGGYAASARAMMAAAHNAGVPGAAETYAKWRTWTPKMDADFVNNPTWAIVPRQ